MTEPDLTHNVGLVLRMALEDAGMSQSEVARQLGVSPAHVNQLLSGRRNMSLARVENILNVTGHTLWLGLDRQNGDDLDVGTVSPSGGPAARAR